MPDLTKPEPYEGPEHYIFVSYSHKDMDRVLPIIRQLTEDGYRIWYDDGIHPGTEWPEVIAQHLNDCALFLAFLSNSYMDSFNCKREIDFAVRKRKTFLTVFLEETQLSLGVEMQISTVQSVDYYKTTPEIFLKKIKQFEVLENSGCYAGQSAVEPAVQAVEKSAGQVAGVSYVQSVGVSAGQAEGVSAGQGAEVSSGQDVARKQSGDDVSRPRKAKKFLIPVLLGVLILFGAVSAIIGIGVSKSNRKIQSVSGSASIELKDSEVTARVLKKEAKGKKLRKIKLTNCELSLKDKAIWSEILAENVTEITVTGCKLTDEDANEILRNAPGLRTLNFSDNQITTLIITNNPKIEKINADNNQIHHIEAGNLEKLTTLSVNGNRLSGLEFLKTAIHLHTLNADANEISSVDTLNNCALLYYVSLADNRISDVSPLAASKDVIKKLHLANNDIESMDSVWPMPELERLNADNNLLTEIYLTGSPKLSYLSVRNNRIDSLSGDFGALTYIDAADNKLSGDYYFTESPKLRTGLFENNNITAFYFSGEKFNSGSFSFYNNPTVSLNFGEEKAEYNLYASYNKDLGEIFKTKTGRHLYLLDCPYDLRVQYEKAWGNFSVSFPEGIEMEESVEKLRKTF